MGYLGKHGVDTLKKYKYSGQDRSIMAKYVFQPFWSRFVLIFPLWMPPNMITLLGFFFVLASALLSYLYSPQLVSPSPKWVHFLHGLLLFLYQTFDAVDGKQARRTHSSSPLGELFDHGCDALTCAFETMAFGDSVMSGSHTLWFWAISSIQFFAATWEHFFTHSLILPEISGPTEGLMLIYLIHFFTAFVGPTWWTQKTGHVLSFLSGFSLLADLPVYDFVAVVMMMFAVFPTVAYNVFNVHKVVRSKNGSMLRAIAMIFPYVFLIGGTTIWGLISPSDILGVHPHLVLIGIGFAFAYLVGRMILAQLCDEPKGLKTGMYTSLAIIPFGIVNAMSANLLNRPPLIEEKWLLYGFCVFTTSLYLHFAVSVIHEITNSLGIHCFRIGRKEA